MNRFARRRAAAKARTSIQKKEPFGRLAVGSYDEATNKLTLKHTTRGTSVRTLTDSLMNTLAA